MRTEQQSIHNLQQRRYDLDWLRILAFTLLVFYHTSLIFELDNWVIYNKESSSFLEYFAYSVSQWRMPLICIISGGGVFFAFKKRSTKTFLSERLRRLLIPLIFGVLFITTPQMYFYQLFKGHDIPSYLDFQKSIFEFKIFPKGNLDWFHLWFIGYLLLYCIITLPLFVFLRKEKGKQLISKVTTLITQRKGLIFLLSIPLIIIDILIGLYWNPYGSKFLSLLVFFTYGYIFFSNTQFLILLQKYRKYFLPFAIITALIILLIGDKKGVGDVYVHSGLADFVLAKILKNINILLWLFTIVGYAGKYLNFNHSLLKYANEAVYPFYILHQTIMVILGYYIIQLHTNILVKFLLISLGTFTISLLIYEFIIRRNSVTRFLFGLKAQSKLVNSKKEDSYLGYKKKTRKLSGIFMR